MTSSRKERRLTNATGSTAGKPISTTNENRRNLRRAKWPTTEGHKTRAVQDLDTAQIWATKDLTREGKETKEEMEAFKSEIRESKKNLEEQITRNVNGTLKPKISDLQ